MTGLVEWTRLMVKAVYGVKNDIVTDLRLIQSQLSSILFRPCDSTIDIQTAGRIAHDINGQINSVQRLVMNLNPVDTEAEAK